MVQQKWLLLSCTVRDAGDSLSNYHMGLEMIGLVNAIDITLLCWAAVASITAIAAPLYYHICLAFCDPHCYYMR